MVPEYQSRVVLPLAACAVIYFGILTSRWVYAGQGKVEARSWNLHYFDEKIEVPKSEKKGHFH